MPLYDTHMCICSELIDPSVLIAIKTEGVKLRVRIQEETWGQMEEVIVGVGYRRNRV